jgi:hypothetical protein
MVFYRFFTIIKLIFSLLFRSALPLAPCFCRFALGLSLIFFDFCENYQTFWKIRLTVLSVSNTILVEQETAFVGQTFPAYNVQEKSNPTKIQNTIPFIAKYPYSVVS